LQFRSFSLSPIDNLYSKEYNKIVTANGGIPKKVCPHFAFWVDIDFQNKIWGCFG